MEFALDCRDSMDAIHTQLAEVLSFPAWYGRNLLYLLLQSVYRLCYR